MNSCVLLSKFEDKMQTNICKISFVSDEIYDIKVFFNFHAHYIKAENYFQVS